MNQQTPSKRLLTVKEVADDLAVSQKTVVILIESDKLAATDVGTASRRNFRIHPDALAAYIGKKRTP